MTFDHDLTILANLMSAYDHGGMLAVIRVLQEEQIDRNLERERLADLDAKVSADPENKHGAW